MFKVESEGTWQLRWFSHTQSGVIAPRFCWLPVVFLTLTGTSCGIFTAREPARAKPVLYQWADDGGPGEISVSIDLSKQTATFHRGDRQIGWSYVSTGKEGHSTSPGTYSVMEKMPLKVSNRYGWIADAAGNVTNGDATPKTPVPPGEFYHGAPMHYWMRVTGYGVGMHAGEIPRPGEAASHGCIRLPRNLAPKLYEVVKVGTPVRIERGKSRSSRQIPALFAHAHPPESHGGTGCELFVVHHAPFPLGIAPFDHHVIGR